LVATVSVPGPFEVLTRPTTLKPRDRQSFVLGPKVRVEAVHLSPAADESGLPNLINGSGLREVNGFKAHGTNTSDMWLGDWKDGLSIEFELSDPASLAAIAVWNYNADWQTTNGIRKADVAVSADGATWQTVLRGVEFAEADGTAAYDDPTVLKLEGVKAQKVRFENIVPRGADGKVGASEVAFHEAVGSRASAREPEDNAMGVPLKQVALAWTPVTGATSYRAYLGTNSTALAELGTTNETSWPVAELSPRSAYFWRVDASVPGGQTIPGRLERFNTGGLVAWFKLDETEGNQATDSSGNGTAAEVNGQPHWAPGQGTANGALEFDGKENFLNCGNPPALNFRGGMTVSVWFKVRQFNRRYQTIATKGETTWRIHRNAERDTVSFSLDGPQLPGNEGRSPRLQTRRAVNDGQWHHIVALYDGQRAALYLDGQVETSVRATGPIAQNAEPVMIGENAVSRERFFNGWMDDVRLYDYGLSEEEVLALYRAGRPVEKNGN
jgi:hypothetical protein